MMGLKKKSKRIFLQRLFSFDGVLIGIKTENGYLTGIIKYGRFTNSCKIFRFPLFIPNIPLFHHSIRFIKQMAERTL